MVGRLVRLGPDGQTSVSPLGFGAFGLEVLPVPRIVARGFFQNA